MSVMNCIVRWMFYFVLHTHTHTHRVVYGEEIFPDPCTFENEFGFLLCWLVDCLVVHIFPVLVWEIHSTCYQSASVRAVSSLQ